MLYSVEVGLGVEDATLVEAAYSQAMPIREHLMQLGLASLHLTNQSLPKPPSSYVSQACALCLPTLIRRFLQAVHPALDF